MATIEKSSFMGNIERSIKLGKMFPSTETGNVRKIKEEDGATFFKVEIGVVVDANFPTKAGNTTTAMIIVPLDGGKDFPTSWGKIKMNGIPPFIYQGRGASMVFTSLNTNGDVMKKNTSRRSASAEIDEIKKQLAAIAAMLTAKK